MNNKNNNNNKDVHDEICKAELHVENAKTNQLVKAQEDYEKSGYEEKRDFANQLVGRIRMAQGISKLTTVVSLVDLALIKKNKLYQSLAGSAIQGSGEKVPTVSTWEGFCNSLGMSKSKVDEDIKNLETFGEDALKAMNYVGLGYRDLRKLRKLPEEERAVIVGEVEANLDDKDSIICLIDDMVCRHTKEKESLQTDLEESKKDLGAARKVTEGKDNKINELEEEIHRYDLMTVDETISELSEKLNRETMYVIGGLRGLEAVINQITELENTPRELFHARGQVLARLLIDIDDIHCRYCIDRVDLDFNEAETG